MRQKRVFSLAGKAHDETDDVERWDVGEVRSGLRMRDAANRVPPKGPCLGTW